MSGEFKSNLLQSGDNKKKGDHSKEIHVTWDEAQLAEHDKTRGKKMKIDEPKTPYVTDEEFQRLCAEDPDYQKALLAGELVEPDINSQEAEGDADSDLKMDEEMALAKHNMKLNMNYNMSDPNSDEEGYSPKRKLKQDAMTA